MQPISSDFAEYIAAQEPELAKGLVECLETTAPSVAVRLNRRKLAPGERPAVTAGAIPVPWCRWGWYLPERPDFTHDPAMHQGLYYVQDASSMITFHVTETLATWLREENACGRPIRYLDACAAPGGKTTAAIDALPDSSLVVANEFDFRRASILKENVIKWGYADVAVSRGDTAQFRRMPGFFDIIAADVPCSGEGMMRKDETARRQWSKGLVEDCARRQREIAMNLWEALRPGGFFVYSTCTFNRVENEDNVAWLMAETGAEMVEIPVADEWGITVRDGMMRFLPTRLQGEGLFMAVLRKPDGDACGDGSTMIKIKRKERGNRRDTSADAERRTVAEWSTRISGDMTLSLQRDTLTAYPTHLSKEYIALAGALDMIYQGVEMATAKGRGLMPSHPLAIAQHLAGGAFPSVDVDRDTALSYLRHEATGGFEAPRGPVLLMFNGHPLGFVNNLGNRANNLYPAPWRILK